MHACTHTHTPPSPHTQDAQEFFLHLLSVIDKNQRTKPGTLNPVDYFRYQTEERIKCTVSGKVRYSLREDNLLALPVPVELATNKCEGYDYIL